MVHKKGYLFSPLKMEPPYIPILRDFVPFSASRIPHFVIPCRPRCILCTHTHTNITPYSTHVQMIEGKMCICIFAGSYSYIQRCVHDSYRLNSRTVRPRGRHANQLMREASDHDDKVSGSRQFHTNARIVSVDVRLQGGFVYSFFRGTAALFLRLTDLTPLRTVSRVETSTDLYDNIVRT